MSKQFYLRTADGHVFTTSYPEYHKGDEQLTQAEGLRLYRQQCIKGLQSIIKQGQTIYTIVRSVSSSGMSRRISLYTIVKGEMMCIDHRAAVVTGWTHHRDGGLVINGCGMDMCFHAVYTLSRYLFPKGTRKTKNTEAGKDGGYALKHSTL